MKNARSLLLVASVALAGAARADLDFDAGAGLRIRQEIMDNIQNLYQGGRASGVRPHGKYANWVRFRPRVWGELKGVTADETTWRLYARLTDEMRWYVQPSKNHPYSFPDEAILDNLFLEAKGLFDGFMDVSVGRQDMMFLYGLDHIFVDGTPGDGSRTVYSDMVRFGFNFDKDRRLDLLALYDFDDADDLRWGTRRGKHRALSGLGGAEPDMDDWGFGAIWNDKLFENVPYQLFLIQKDTASYYHPKYGKRPRTQRELLGTKVVPQLTDEWSLQLEAMGQVGQNGEGDTLHGESGYAGVNWKSAAPGVKPFAMFGYHYMSGDKDAADEDGGHGAWDPMWSRGETDSAMFLYGSLYGVGLWSNQHALRATAGLDIGRHHRVSATLSPIWAATQDDLGGGDGSFKGFQTFLRYDFPLLMPGTPAMNSFGAKHRGLEVWGHVLAEFLNPGDYYESDKPAYFLRWQVEMKF